MKSRKGAILFSILLVVFVVFILIYAWSVLSSKYHLFDKNIGQRQYELINTFQKAESALLFIDQSAKYSGQQSVYDLAKQGGYYESSCGSYSGVTAWASIEKVGDKLSTKECYPSDQTLKESFLKFFDDTLKNYLANYPDANIPASYGYELNDNIEVTGKATENLVIDIVPDKFVVQPGITSTDTNEIFNQVTNGEIPKKLNVPMSSNPDIETIKLYHPEVWIQYTELCKRMGATTLGYPPGVCKSLKTPCCITSGYRHPAYNKEIGGAGNSPHQYGVAIDIYVGKNVKEQLRWADEASKLFTRVGIYPSQTDIHVDLMPPTGQFQTRFWIGKKGITLATANSIGELENKAKAYT